MKNRISIITALLIIVFLPVAPVLAADVSELFGPDSYFHPFISIEQTWSDNIFKTEKNTKSDYWVTTKPGIWLALPGSSRFNPPVEEMSSFQAFLKYNPDLINHASENDNDDIDHNLEGYLYYSGDGGLSITLKDIFKDGHDDISENIDNIHYIDNTFSTDIRYEISEKIAVNLGYSHFTENYDRKKNIEDRKESLYKAAVYYGLMPKTAVFLEFALNDIKYDNFSEQDSKETEYNAGIKWEITDRTTGEFKAGYLNKDFKSSAISDKSIMKFILDGSYELTSKSTFLLTAKNETNETDELKAAYFESTSLLSTYRYAMTERVTGFFSIFYVDDDFNIDRKDTTINVAPSVTYKYNDIFSCDFAYTYEDVDSKGGNAGEAYTTNIVLLTLSATM